MAVHHHYPLDSWTALRLQRGVEVLHRLGPRATAGYLDELTRLIGGLPAALTLLNEYERRLSPDMLRVTGGDRFPPRPMRAVPR